MQRTLLTGVAALLLATSIPALAAGMDSMRMAAKPGAMTATTDYRFELAGPPRSTGGGKSIVSVKLVHVPDNKPVSGAIVIGEKADMGPIGMAAMTAPVKVMPEKNGVYQFAIQNGGVWKKPDNWSLSIDAKVQGEPQTVHGNVVVKLTP